MENLTTLEIKPWSLSQLSWATIGAMVALNFSVTPAVSKDAKFDMSGILEDDTTFVGEFEYDSEAEMVMVSDKFAYLPLTDFSLNMKETVFLSSALGDPGGLLFSKEDDNMTSAEMELGNNISINNELLQGALLQFDEVPTDIMTAPQWMANQDLLKFEGNLTENANSLEIDSGIAQKMNKDPQTVPEPSTIFGLGWVFGVSVFTTKKK